MESKALLRGVQKIYRNVCCFFGHREIFETEELKVQLREVVEKLIVDEKVHTFLFGSKSRFNDLCYETVTQLKEKYSHIKRIYVRAEYPFISDSYKSYLLEAYEDTYYPEKLIGANRSVYVKGNFEMVDSSRFCVVYCKGKHTPSERKSGAKIAFDYAVKHNKIIYRFPMPDVKNAQDL